MVLRLDHIHPTNSNTLKGIRPLARENSGSSILDLGVGRGAAASFITHPILGNSDELTRLLRYQVNTPVIYSVAIFNLELIYSLQNSDDHLIQSYIQPQHQFTRNMSSRNPRTDTFSTVTTT